MTVVDGTPPPAAERDRPAVAADAPPDRDRRVATAALWLWSLSLAVATALRHLSGSFLPRDIVNADTLGPPAVFDAVRMDGLGALLDWHWPAAPYFLIDVVLYLPIWLAAPDPWLAPAIFLVTQLLLLQYAVNGFCRSIEPRSWPLSALIGYTLLVGLANLEIRPVFFLLVSSFHAGAFITTLLLVRWFIGSGAGEQAPDEAGSRGVRRAAGVGAATGLLVLSDPLFLVSTVAPLVVVALGVRRPAPARSGDGVRWRGAGAPMVAMVVGSAAGLALNSAIRSPDTPYGPQLAGSDLLGRLGGLGSELAAVDPRLGAAVVVSAVVGAIALALSPPGDRGRLAIVAAFWAIGLASHGVALVLTDGSTDVRYLQVALLLPVVAVGPSVVRIATALGRVGPGRIGWGPAATGWGVGLLAVPVVLVPAVSGLPSVRATERPELVACVDGFLGPDHEALIGIADYWSARRLQLFAGSDTRVVGMDWHGRPLRINTSDRWLGRSYDYVVIERNPSGWSPPADQFLASGLVAASTTCGSFELIRFAEPGLDLPMLDDPGETVTYDGCLLRAQSGRVDGDRCEIQVDGADADTFGSFGGYLLLGPGRYRATFDYASPGPPGDDVAVAEITRKGRGLEELHVVATRMLPGTGGLPGSVEIEFEVGPESSPDGAVVEARTVVRGDYSVRSVTFQALGSG